MELAIDFEEILLAFEASDVNHHYIIDTEKGEMLYVNEEIDMDASEQLERLEGNRYLAVPPRLPRDDYAIMELFAYEIEPFELAEKFHTAIERSKPFRNFKNLLRQHPELEGRWFKFRENHIRNEAISWLSQNNIGLKGQKLVPDIVIKELSAEDMKALPKELEGFGPMGCANCGKVASIAGRWFETNTPPENALVEKETGRIMKETFGVSHYGNFVGERVFLTAAKCPKCGSEEVFWDF